MCITEYNEANYGAVQGRRQERGHIGNDISSKRLGYTRSYNTTKIRRKVFTNKRGITEIFESLICGTGGAYISGRPAPMVSKPVGASLKIQ